MNPVITTIEIGCAVTAIVLGAAGVYAYREAGTHWIRQRRNADLLKGIGDRADAGEVWKSSDMKEFDAQTKEIAAGNRPAITARTKRRKLIGLSTAVTGGAIAAAAIALCIISGVAASAEDSARSTAENTRLSHEALSRYGLPGHINLDQWRSNDTSFMHIFDGPIVTCPAGADRCYQGAVLTRTGAIQTVDLVVTHDGPVLTDTNGVELPRPAAASKH